MRIEFRIDYILFQHWSFSNIWHVFLSWIYTHVRRSRANPNKLNLVTSGVEELNYYYYSIVDGTD